MLLVDNLDLRSSVENEDYENEEVIWEVTM